MDCFLIVLLRFEIAINSNLNVIKPAHQLIEMAKSKQTICDKLLLLLFHFNNVKCGWTQPEAGSDVQASVYIFSFIEQVF